MADLSAPLFAYVFMLVGFTGKFQSILLDALEDELDPERKAVIAAEQEKISGFETGAEC